MVKKQRFLKKAFYWYQKIAANNFKTIQMISKIVKIMSFPTR